MKKKIEYRIIDFVFLSKGASSEGGIDSRTKTQSQCQIPHARVLKIHFE